MHDHAVRVSCNGQEDMIMPKSPFPVRWIVVVVVPGHMLRRSWP